MFDVINTSSNNLKLESENRLSVSSNCNIGWLPCFNFGDRIIIVFQRHHRVVFHRQLRNAILYIVAFNCSSPEFKEKLIQSQCLLKVIISKATVLQQPIHGIPSRIME